MRKSCSSDREKLLKFEAEGREFEKFYSNRERSEQFLVTECFLNYYLTMSTKLEQLECKLEQNIGI